MHLLFKNVYYSTVVIEMIHGAEKLFFAAMVPVISQQQRHNTI